MDDISSVIVSLQEASESHEKSIAIEHRALERRLEECVTVSAAYVTTMQTRYSELEKSFQEREERMRSKQRELEEELLKGLREGNELSANERMELSQRMILVEKMVESVMERVDMSKSVFEGLFSSSPEVKRFQNAAVKLEGLLVEFTSIRYPPLSSCSSLSSCPPSHMSTLSSCSSLSSLVFPVEMSGNSMQPSANSKQLLQRKLRYCRCRDVWSPD
jgi:hypothetical protein